MAMRTTIGGVVILTVLISACGGEGEAVPPPQAPPPPAPAAAPAPPAAAGPAAPEAPKQPLIELQKQSAQTSLAAFNGHDAKKFSETYAAEGVITAFGVAELKGREAIAADMQKFFEAFPDLKMAISKNFVKGDVVVSEWVVNGTHKGEFMGQKATNKPVGLRGVSVLSFGTDGLIKQDHRYYDGATLMTQVGQMKSPVRAVPPMPSGEPEWHVAKGTPDEDKQVELAKTLYGSFEKKVEADFLGSMDEKVVWSDVSAPKDMTGKGEAKKFFQMFTKALPDLKQTLDPIFAADEYVVAEATMTGTHNGQLGPLKPTKKPVTMHGVDIIMVKDGKIQRGVTYSNNLEILGQEGLLPKPKTPKPDAKAEGDKKAAGADKAAGEKSEKPKADKPKADKPAEEKK